LGLRNGLKDGVNLHGFFLAETGLGESARLLYQAFKTQEICTAACIRELSEGRNNALDFQDLVQTDAPYNVGVNIDGLIGYRGLRHQICRNKYNIAYPFWELESIPERYLNYLRTYDKIWAPSSFIFHTLERHGFTNIEVVKHPIRMPDQQPAFFDVRSELRILFYFDFDSFPARKNPEAAVHAFKKAFGREKDVSLTVKVRGQADAGRRAWLANQANADRRIQIVDRLMSRQEMSLLMNEHDVFISLHRSEGLGLGIAEALAAGKAVVATDYGGSTDFINVQTGFPVQWDRVNVGANEYVLSDNATWAEPSVEHAAALLRSIYDDPLDARLRVEHGFRHLRENHCISVIGNQIAHSLRQNGTLNS
jgi:glycosyltransferase involved in cell wall biosynthesis